MERLAARVPRETLALRQRPTAIMFNLPNMERRAERLQIATDIIRSTDLEKQAKNLMYGLRPMQKRLNGFDSAVNMCGQSGLCYLSAKAKRQLKNFIKTLEEIQEQTTYCRFEIAERLDTTHEVIAKVRKMCSSNNTKSNVFDLDSGSDTDIEYSGDTPVATPVKQCQEKKKRKFRDSRPRLERLRRRYKHGKPIWYKKMSQTRTKRSWFRKPGQVRGKHILRDPEEHQSIWNKKRTRKPIQDIVEDDESDTDKKLSPRQQLIAKAARAIDVSGNSERPTLAMKGLRPVAQASDSEETDLEISSDDDDCQPHNSGFCTNSDSEEDEALAPEAMTREYENRAPEFGSIVQRQPPLSITIPVNRMSDPVTPMTDREDSDSDHEDSPLSMTTPVALVQNDDPVTPMTASEDNNDYFLMPNSNEIGFDGEFPTSSLAQQQPYQQISDGLDEVYDNGLSTPTSTYLDI